MCMHGGNMVGSLLYEMSTAFNKFIEIIISLKLLLQYINPSFKALS